MVGRSVWQTSQNGYLILDYNTVYQFAIFSILFKVWQKSNNLFEAILKLIHVTTYVSLMMSDNAFDVEYILVVALLEISLCTLLTFLICYHILKQENFKIKIWQKI